VLWRPTGAGATELALVHRPKYDDWSLPKGKLDPGEHPLLAGLREVEEETGFPAVPGRSLGELHYVKSGRAKRVRYWACRALPGDFRPSSEVDRIRWMPPADAAHRLSADRDRVVVKRHAQDLRDTRALVVVRHASAGDKDAWPGEDRDRPLDEEGQRQAVVLAALLRAYAVQVAVSADVVRCRDTLAPFATASGVAVRVARPVTAGRFEHDPSAGVDLAMELAAEAPAVLSGQREVLGDLLAGLLGRLGHPLPAALAETPKGSAVVLHLARSEQPGRTDRPDRPVLAGVELLLPT